MQVNNIAKVVNFIIARIFEPNANDLINSSYGKELFCAIGQDVEVAENTEVDIEGVKQRLAKYIPNAALVSIREFEVTTFDDEFSDTQFLYELKLKCVLNRWSDAGRIEENAQHTFYFRLVSNYPNGGYRLEEDFNYKNNEWMSEDGNLNLVVGWKFNECGRHYSRI
jgi:hypothetical protein